MAAAVTRFVLSLSWRVKRLQLALSDRVDLIRSRNREIEDCTSVCLMLGPYRNLTTLTAATLFLHPTCQVLNHAGARIYGNGQVDFLSEYSEERFDRFVRFAITISAKGQGGSLGGSITHSHAFDYPRMTEAFGEDPRLIKERITCLCWKQSLKTSNRIRDARVDLPAILGSNDRLRFLMPVRHPLDCAESNLRTGHLSLFRGLDKESSVFDVVDAVLDEIYWFALQQEAWPDRFFCFFEHAISAETLVELATFLDLDPSASWLSKAKSVMVTESRYDHSSELVGFYRQAVSDRFSRFPVMSEGLLAFSADQ